MQFYSLTKSFLISCVILSLIQFSLQCDNACNDCQRAVYELKFHGLPDCTSFVCKDTCFKVREGWNSPTNLFEYFKNDVFGKCEICFRAGFCSMSACDSQRLKELEVINSVINTNQLSAKLPGNPLIADAGEPTSKTKLNALKSQNENIIKLLRKSLNKAQANKTSIQFMHYMRQLYHSYFDSPFQLPTDVTEVLAKLNEDVKIKAGDINDDQIIKGYSILTDLENRITEMEQMANEYAKNKKGKKLDPSLKKKLSEVISSLKADFKKYQQTFEKNISELNKNKLKIKSIKKKIAGKKIEKKEEKDDDDDDSSVVILIEDKVNKIEHSFKNMEKEISKNKEKLNNVLKIIK